MRLLIKCTIIKINKIVDDVEMISNIVLDKAEKANLIDILNQYEITIS